MTVYLSPGAESALFKLLEHLENEWGVHSRNKFLYQFEKKLDLISAHPGSCPKSKILKGLHKCVVTKQCSFYYRTNTKLQEIEIITVFDTRRNPDHLKNT